MLIAGHPIVAGFLKSHPATRGLMARWTRLVELAAWRDITETRATFATADAINGTVLSCFNLGGNKFRLLTSVSYSRQQVVIRSLLTHAEYSRKYMR